MNDAIDRIFNAADSCSADDLRGPIREELARRDAAWARYVSAVMTLRGGRFWERTTADSAALLAEIDAAHNALRAMGIDAPPLP
jgi:hypothetical protein